MANVQEATHRLLSERPEMEPQLRELLAIDAENDTWTFDDVSLDSGTFGEVVSRGIVTRVGEEYRLADRGALASVLHGEEEADEETGRDWNLQRLNPGRLVGRIRTNDVLALLVGLALILLVRTVLVSGMVFRDGHVILAGNDPYRFRFWVEHLLATDLSAFDLGDLGEVPSNLRQSDTLMFVTMWWLAALFGGTSKAAGLVLAWYPVVIACFLGLAVYWLTWRLVRDRRAAVAALLLFACIPVNTYRTMLGFGDHHAFDYLWLGLTVVSLMGLVADTAEFPDYPIVSPRDGLFTLLLGVAVAGQVLAWRGGPLLIFPIAIYVVGQTLIDLRDGRPIIRGTSPLVAGLGLGAVLAGIPHLLWGWAPPYRALAPLLLVTGTVSMLGATALAKRIGFGPRRTVATLSILGLAGILGLWQFVPPVSSGITDFVTYMQTYTGSGIAETVSLFNPASGLFFAPMFSFSFIFLLAIPPLLRGTAGSVRTNDSGWLLIVCYTWFFLALSVVQLRFAGQLSIFIGVLGGVGFVRLANWVDLATPLSLHRVQQVDAGMTHRKGTEESGTSTLSVPDRGTLSRLGLLFLLVLSLSFIQIPIQQRQLAVDETRYEAAVWMEAYAAEKGWEYPENYVFSKWGHNLAYNQVVNGKTSFYDFAKEHYGAFLMSPEPERWYDQLHERTGFIVTRDLESTPPTSMHARLHSHHGSENGDVPGLAHYRTVYVSQDKSLVVTTLVPGATISGTGVPNSTVTARVTVDVPGAEFVYRRTIETDHNGRFQFTTPYPGTYRVGNATVSVSEEDTLRGSRINMTSE